MTLVHILLLIAVSQTALAYNRGLAEKKTGPLADQPVADDDKPVHPADVVRVRVKQGLVSGAADLWPGSNKYKTTFTKVWKFYNIPYAAPPVEERRFKNPVPMKGWDGVWNGTKERGELVECIQFRHVWGGPNKVVGQEDCLYLSIYTPTLPYKNMNSSELRPVVVYIHGGSFMYGSQNHYEPTALVAGHKLVVVKLNYRLGPFGFLSTGDNEVPGNMGLRDQIMALQWVQENIAEFGGDKNSVTLAGSYAGGASVHFHMLSEKSKGLFHRAISMSGTMLSPWSLAENLPEKTNLIANHVGCLEKDISQMISCLRSRPATHIVDGVRQALPILYHPSSPWAPVIDSYSSDPLIPQYPGIQMSQSNGSDIPWLVGVSNADGYYMAAELLNDERLPERLNDEWSKLIQYLLDYEGSIDDKCDDAKEEVGITIRDEYMTEETNTHGRFGEMIGDRLFVVDAERSARWMSKSSKSPVFFYYLNALNKDLSTTDKDTFLRGAQHVDDLLNAVHLKKTLRKFEDADAKKISFMHELWASFARDGEPNVASWAVVKPETFSYMQINGVNNQSLECAKEIGRRNFWQEIPFKEYNRYPDPLSVPVYITPEVIVTHIEGPMHRNRPSFPGPSYKLKMNTK